MCLYFPHTLSIMISCMELEQFQNHVSVFRETLTVQHKQQCSLQLHTGKAGGVPRGCRGKDHPLR